jgi:hypothetical protein
VIVDNGLTSFHISHVMQVPCDSSTRGVYRIVDIQANLRRGERIRGERFESEG